MLRKLVIKKEGERYRAVMKALDILCNVDEDDIENINAKIDYAVNNLSTDDVFYKSLSDYVDEIERVIFAVSEVWNICSDYWVDLTNKE